MLKATLKALVSTLSSFLLTPLSSTYGSRKISVINDATDFSTCVASQFFVTIFVINGTDSPSSTIKFRYKSLGMFSFSEEWLKREEDTLEAQYRWSVFVA